MPFDFTPKGKTPAKTTKEKGNNSGLFDFTPKSAPKVQGTAAPLPPAAPVSSSGYTGIKKAVASAVDILLNRPKYALLAAGISSAKMRQQGISPWNIESIKAGGREFVEGLRGIERPTGEQLLEARGWKPGLGRSIVGGAVEVLTTPAFGPIMKAGSKIAAPIANKTISKLAGAGVSGGIYGGAEAIAEQKPAVEVAKSAALNAALFGGAEAGLLGLGKIASKTISKVKPKTNVKPLKETILALPAPKQLPKLEIAAPKEVRVIPEFTPGGPIPRPGRIGEQAAPPLTRGEEIAKPLVKEPAKPLPGELNAAKNILKKKGISTVKASKVLEAYPELKPEVPKVVKRIEKQKIEEAKRLEKEFEKVTAAKLKAEVKAKTETAAKPVTIEVKPAEAKTIRTLIEEAPNLKDISGFQSYTQDITRNFRDVFGKHFEKAKKEFLDPFDVSKKANIEFQENLLKELKTNIVDKLGIKKSSKESALLQDFGEKKITLEQLKERRPKDWQNFVEADKWFRQKYDDLLEAVNAVRKQIYPNDPSKIIPKRKNYYRHFREIADSIEGLRNIFDTPAQIDPNLAGISGFTLPKTKWASFAQKRGLGKYKKDAVGGFLDYVPAAGYAIHIDPHIGRFEKLASELAKATEQSKNLNGFINFLRRFSQDLAGKTNVIDRAVQEIIPGGRNTIQAINWLNNRVKANTVLGNASSALAQLANIPQGIAFAKKYAVKGMGRTLASIFAKNEPMLKSGFLKERYAQRMYRQFDPKWLEQPASPLAALNSMKNFAIWMLETADEIGAKFIWNSCYAKALAEKIPDPIAYADMHTRRLVAGRGIGEVPLMQKSKLFQIFAPFQVEVGNLWKVQRDFVKAKDFGALATLYLANYLFNRVMEQTRGSAVVFDPIQAMIEAFTEEDITPLQRGGRLAGEVFSNVPLGQSIAAIYPEYGAGNLPSRRELFGSNDPTRYGTGILIAKGLQDPRYKIFLPFAGGQVEKTTKGIDALKEKGVYTPDKTKMKYPVQTDNANVIKGLLFGPAGFPETKEYYDKNRRPLSEKQTQELEKERLKGKNIIKPYNELMYERELKSIDNKINELKKDKTIPIAERLKRIEMLNIKRRKLQVKHAIQ